MCGSIKHKNQFNRISKKQKPKMQMTVLKHWMDFEVFHWEDYLFGRSLCSTLSSNYLGKQYSLLYSCLILCKTFTNTAQMFGGACANSSICFSGIGPVVVFVMYLWKCFKIKQITSNIFAAFFNAITSFLLFSCTSKIKGSIVCGNENICKWISEGGYKCQSEATVDKLLYFMLLHPWSLSMCTNG